MWYITHDGKVQPFGAVFWNRRGDVGRWVKTAVARLNRGLDVVEGGRGVYRVTMEPCGIAKLEFLRFSRHHQL